MLRRGKERGDEAKKSTFLGFKAPRGGGESARRKLYKPNSSSRAKQGGEDKRGLKSKQKTLGEAAAGASTVSGGQSIRIFRKRRRFPLERKEVGAK